MAARERRQVGQGAGNRVGARHGGLAPVDTAAGAVEADRQRDGRPGGGPGGVDDFGEGAAAELVRFAREVLAEEGNLAAAVGMVDAGQAGDALVERDPEQGGADLRIDQLRRLQIP